MEFFQTALVLSSTTKLLTLYRFLSSYILNIYYNMMAQNLSIELYKNIIVTQNVFQ